MLCTAVWNAIMAFTGTWQVEALFIRFSIRLFGVAGPCSQKGIMKPSSLAATHAIKAPLKPARLAYNQGP
jgi:hypothetical protein